MFMVKIAELAPEGKMGFKVKLAAQEFCVTPPMQVAHPLLAFTIYTFAYTRVKVFLVLSTCTC
jgi:hypothetical protein